MEKKLPSELAQIVGSFAKLQPLRLMFQDEARFGRISDCRYCWAPRPLRPTVKAMLTHQYVYAYAAVSPMDGAVDSLVLPAVNGGCMELFLHEVATRHPRENIVMVLDGAGWHHGAMRLPPNLKLHFLPPYSPELNPVEQLWAHLREKHFHNRAFDSLDALEDHLVDALRALEQHPNVAQSTTKWPWIIDAVFNAN